MRTCVVYDSKYGNTERVARAVAEGLAGGGEVDVAHVDELAEGRLEGVATLVVGCPTHAFRPSEATQAFLKRLPTGRLEGVGIAAFDTRFAEADMPARILRFFARTFGEGVFAARKVDRALVRAGGHRLTPPQAFYVRETEGPLRDGELERATAWGRRLAAAEHGDEAPDRPERAVSA